MSDIAAKLIEDTFRDVDSALRERGLSTYANDLAYAKRELYKHIADLEAQLDALRTPPYTLIINRDEFLGDVSWSWQVVRGELQIAYQGDYAYEYEARAVGKVFLDKLTAPFGAKGE